MFHDVVVGVDGHDGSRDAIALARKLLGADGKLTFAHVYAGDPHVYAGVSAAYAAAERARALELLEHVRRESHVEATLRCVESPSVGRGLHEIAEHERADLLVLGSSRRSLVGRVLIGDDTHAALNGAPCAVAVAPAGYATAPGTVHQIGVAYDGSPESLHALELARRLADGLGANLSAFKAVTVPTSAFGPGPLPIGDVIDRLVDEARREIEALGGVEAHAAYGQTVEELTFYSASVDLLVAGSRGYGPIGRLIHGSTSQHLARSARCPVLILPRGTRSTLQPVPEHSGQSSRVVSSC